MRSLKVGGSEERYSYRSKDPGGGDSGRWQADTGSTSVRALCACPEERGEDEKVEVCLFTMGEAMWHARMAGRYVTLLRPEEQPRSELRHSHGVWVALRSGHLAAFSVRGNGLLQLCTLRVV